MKKLLIPFVILPLAACGGDTAPLSEEELQSRPAISSVDFGSDDGDWANDSECDDPRFRGPGMTGTPLLDEDIRSDASDCRAAYENGTITLKE